MHGQYNSETYENKPSPNQKTIDRSDFKKDEIYYLELHD